MGRLSHEHQAFFANHLTNGNVTNSRFSIDGTAGSGGGGSGLVATLWPARSTAR